MAYTTTAISVNPQRNKGGAVLNAGTVTAGGPITKALGMTALGYRAGIYSSIVQSGKYAIFVKSNANFNKLPTGKYVGPFICTELGGLTSTAMRSPASAQKFAMQPKSGVRTITYGTFNYVTGKPASTTSTAVNWHSISAGATATLADNAALPTRAVPGELVILVGKTPTYKDYSAKTT